MPADPFRRLSGSETRLLRPQRQPAGFSAVAGDSVRPGHQEPGQQPGSAGCLAPAPLPPLSSPAPLSRPPAGMRRTGRSHHLRAQATPAAVRGGAGAPQARKRTRRRTTDAASAFQCPPNLTTKHAELLRPPPALCELGVGGPRLRRSAVRPVTVCGSAVGRAIPRQRRDECGVAA